MKQPKTLAEYREIPVRSGFAVRTKVTDDGRIVRIPVALAARAIAFEEDTIFTDGETVLAADVDGLYRRRL